MRARCLGTVVVATFAFGAWSVDERGPLSPGARVWLHAHNCYPDGGHGSDRLSRAIGAAAGPIAIEQDVAWDPVRRQSVLSHDLELDGREPTLADHFFGTVAPLLDRALAEGETATWPVMVLHLDFKSDEPAHHAAVWRLLSDRARWLTTAPKTRTLIPPSPLTPGPLLVLTEAGPGQAATFYDRVPVGQRLLIFGSVPSTPADAASPEARVDAAAAAPAQLIPHGATNYQRWTNHPWAVIEQGGQTEAGEWTPADRHRLDAVVARAHSLGLWIRFYTLNGHDPNDEGWSNGYNFGSLERVQPRWTAAIDARVDFVATDQYEAFTEWRRR